MRVMCNPLGSQSHSQISSLHDSCANAVLVPMTTSCWNRQMFRCENKKTFLAS